MSPMRYIIWEMVRSDVEGDACGIKIRVVPVVAEVPSLLEKE